MKKSLLLLLCVAAPIPAFATDLTVTYKYKGGGSGERIMYYSDQYQLAVDKGQKQDTLVDLQQDITYVVDHRTKTIQVMKMSDMANMMGDVGGMMDQMSGMKMPGSGGKTVGQHQQEGMNKMMGDPNAAKLEKLGPQQVAGRTCEAYRVQRKGGYMEMTEEVCIDSSLLPPGKVSASTQQMGQNAKAMMGGGMAGASSPAQDELHAIRGLTLKSVTKVRGQETSEEVTAIKEGPIDVTVFKLPENYQRVDQAKYYQEQMQQMQERMKGFPKQ